MKAINKIIREGLKENEKKVMEKVMGLNSIKDIMKENSDFSFNINISYKKDLNLLQLSYNFKNSNHEISIDFQMSELVFNMEYIEISTTLIEYAISYFNNTDFKVNIGDFDGDCYVGIKEYIESFFDENESSNLAIIDKTTDKLI